MTVSPWGALFYGYGSSYVAAASGFFGLVAAHYNGTATNNGVNANTWGDTAARALGTTKTWPVGTAAIVIAEATVPIFLLGGTAALDLRYGEDGLRAFLSLIGASAKTESTHASFAPSAGWATSTDSPYSAGSTEYTTTPGSYVDVTFTGDAATLIIWGFSNVNNASYTIKEGATTLVTYTSQAEGATYGQFTVATPKVIELSGLGGGSHTVRIEHTGTSGHYLVVDGLLTPTATPTADVYVPLPVHLAQAGYDNYSPLAGETLNDATVDLWADHIESICADYPNVHVVDPRPGWNVATMIDPTDGAHPDTDGHQHIADALIAAINTAQVASQYVGFAA